MGFRPFRYLSELQRADALNSEVEVARGPSGSSFQARRDFSYPIIACQLPSAFFALPFVRSRYHKTLISLLSERTNRSDVNHPSVFDHLRAIISVSSFTMDSRIDSASFHKKKLSTVDLLAASTDRQHSPIDRKIPRMIQPAVSINSRKTAILPRLSLSRKRVVAPDSQRASSGAVSQKFLAVPAATFPCYLV